MLQKSFWTLATAALAVGALLVPAARPANAQVRIKLTAPRTGPLPTGTGIVTPSTTTGGGIVIPSTATVPTTKPATQQVTTPAPTVKPTTTSSPVYQSSPKGFSAGPSLLGAWRKSLGGLVDRDGPDIDGDGYPDINKDHRSK